ncbi:MAG: outer membrane protein, partial [Pseudorhodoplanes sp.]
MASLRLKLMASASVLALTGAAGTAYAADFPVKAVIPVQPQWVWSGFYWGLHAGVGWRDDADSAVYLTRLAGGAPPFRVSQGIDQSSGFPLGGAQIGYNYQFGNWLLGFEADISAARAENWVASLTQGPATFTVNAAEGVDWFGTIRARLGVISWERALLYVTGGLAYGHIESNFIGVLTGPGPIGRWNFANDASDTKWGWTVGGGLEYLLDRNWSVKAEYQYV